MCPFVYCLLNQTIIENSKKYLSRTAPEITNAVISDEKVCPTDY